MKTIKQELQDAIQNVADNYGVIIKSLSVDWIDVSDMNQNRFVMKSIETRDTAFIEPCK